MRATTNLQPNGSGENGMLRSMKRTGVAVLLAVAATACDFEVTNPGPTPDEFLDRREAHQAVANGAAVQLFRGLNGLAYTTSAVTRELFPSGSTSSFGISINQQAGRLTYDDEHQDDAWYFAHQARAIAEQGYDRFQENVESGLGGYGPAAEAALWAGYANRMLGANWCEAALDGGPIVSHTEVLERAEEWFTTAIETAGNEAALADVKTAAIAGRASVRADLGDWTGALADAAVVPTDFVWNARYEDSEQDFYNRTYFAGADQPYRAVTVWNTVYESYYTATGDPRVPWEDTGQLGDASVGLVGGRVPFYRQLKHAERGADIRLSSGLEMRLLEAEDLLIKGDWQGAMDKINPRRVELGLDPWTPASADEAWTAYKRERGIELWIEGRRLSDLRRWEANGNPGDLDALEQAGNPASYLAADQTLCYQIPKGERESNPNIPTQPTG